MKLLVTWLLGAGLGLAQTGPALFVVNKAADSVSVVDTTTGSVRRTIPVGPNPHELAVAPSGEKVYVVNAGGDSVSVIDPETGTETRRITSADFSFPHGIAFTPDSRHALVTSERAGKIVVIDASTDAVIRSIDTDQGGTHMAAIDRDGRWAYFSNRESNTISFMDLEDHEIVANVAVGLGAESFALAPDEREIWVSDRSANTVTVIDVPGRRVVANFPIGERPGRVAFTPDGAFVIIPVASGEVHVFDRNTRHHHRVLRIGSSPGGVVASPDGEQVFVASGADDSVYVISTVTWTVSGQIPVGSGPDGLAIR